jgi:hypothetical protein
LIALRVQAGVDLPHMTSEHILIFVPLKLCLSGLRFQLQLYKPADGFNRSRTRVCQPASIRPMGRYGEGRPHKIKSPAHLSGFFIGLRAGISKWPMLRSAFDRCADRALKALPSVGP